MAVEDVSLNAVRKAVRLSYLSVYTKQGRNSIRHADCAESCTPFVPYQPLDRYAVGLV